MHPLAGQQYPSISVERRFRARHAVIIQGEEELLHDHDWHVVVEVFGSLDDEGLLIDFHLLEAALDEVLQKIRDNTINGTPPFDEMNPSAENIAAYIINMIYWRILPESARDRLEGCRATLEEAPGCRATSWNDMSGVPTSWCH
jgi:6-pyruvoyltetrahydropterin/6-carboxytetrahydropterin synthase